MSDAPPTAATSDLRWAALTVRVAGAWILVGCAAKAFFGTPGDLPPLVQRLPLGTATTFAVVLAIEAFVGVAALVRPGRAWPLAALLLLAFVAVLATQVASGATSCGCFGGKIDVSPWLVLAADASLLTGVLATKPWRLPQGGRMDLVALVAALVLAAAMPLAARQGGAIGGGGWFGAEQFAEWRGKRLLDTPLASWTALGEGRDGVWLLYKDSCEVCGDCLYRMQSEGGNRQVTLLRLPETGKPNHVKIFPSGPWVHRSDLNPSTPSFRTPVRLIVEDGIVTEVTSIMEGDQCP